MEGVRFKTLHSLGPELAFPRLDSDPVMLSGLTFPLSLALSDFFFRVSFLLRYTLPDGCRMAAASPDLTLSFESSGRSPASVLEFAPMECDRSDGCPL